MRDRIKMVHLDLEVTNVEELLQQQVQSLHQAGFLSEVEEPLRLLMEREAVHSTAMGSGAAFPHARWEGCTEPVIGVSRLCPSIPFGDPVMGPVDLVFLILGPEEDPSRHVRLLGRLAKLVQQQETMGKLRKATDEVEFLTHLKSALF
ncbi:MAG: PTS sugar transporter subunit IIA [Acidobacteria bacterium]|uniref:PTS sugar transporter subunit IIA n=1 Tax=Candidatus Polarisedimenticola svalbardensis TaxID=2886004 RepID=A0A8J7C3E6_9BACT|nr:PTS sugar transporter subunit IIA [Candidatus Polarisedimenticola svalbardensis]